MDRTTTTTGSLLHHGRLELPYAEPPGAYRVNPPIYAALVAEWWAQGRMVPGGHDAQWAALAGGFATGMPDRWGLDRDAAGREPVGVS
ncbi:hypothetical protein [Streptomyces sp. NPDC003635]